MQCISMLISLQVLKGVGVFNACLGQWHPTNVLKLNDTHINTNTVYGLYVGT